MAPLNLYLWIYHLRIHQETIRYKRNLETLKCYDSAFMTLPAFAMAFWSGVVSADIPHFWPRDEFAPWGKSPGCLSSEADVRDTNCWIHWLSRTMWRNDWQLKAIKNRQELSPTWPQPALDPQSEDSSSLSRLYRKNWFFRFLRNPRFLSDEACQHVKASLLQVHSHDSLLMGDTDNAKVGSAKACDKKGPARDQICSCFWASLVFNIFFAWLAYLFALFYTWWVMSKQGKTTQTRKYSLWFVKFLTSHSYSNTFKPNWKKHHGHDQLVRMEGVAVLAQAKTTFVFECTWCPPHNFLPKSLPWLAEAP